MAGDIQRHSEMPPSQKRRAAIAFGGGKAATVNRDFKRAGRTYLREGEQVRVLEAPGGALGDSVYAYRKGAEQARIVPRAYLNFLEG